MKLAYSLSVLFLSLNLLIPAKSVVAVGLKEKILVGVVNRTYDNIVIVKTGSGAVYNAQTARAQLIRKNGSPMLFTEIIVGDKVEITGVVGDSNIVESSKIRNLSLYPHHGTVVGKIVSIDLNSASFTISNTSKSLKTVHTDSLTVFKKNNVISTFSALQPGINVSIVATWERLGDELFASEIKFFQRYISIYFVGNLVMKSDSVITVVGNNGAIYGVDIAQAKLQNKKGKNISVSQLNMNDTVRVWDKHISGSLQIIASQIKDISLDK